MKITNNAAAHIYMYKADCLSCRVIVHYDLLDLENGIVLGRANREAWVAIGPDVENPASSLCGHVACR